jgi:small subunit ribosomal protein SAe
MLAAQTHLGSKNVSAKMKKYVFSRREDGIHLMHLGLLWEKLVLAARIIVAIENPKDVCIVSSCPNGHGRRAVLKFAEYVGTTCFIDRYIPGTLTNTTVKGYTEPLLLISIDPFTDAQVLRESQYCNLPVIALANSHNSLRNVDVAIPCNNVSKFSIGVVTWLLARTVLRLRGSLSYDSPWDVPVDMFFYLEEQQEEPEEPTQIGKEWNEKPSWGADDWMGSTSAFEPQSSVNDKVLWSENHQSGNSDWMNPTIGPIPDFKEAFGMTSGEPTSWADDIPDTMNRGFTSNTGGWDSPITNKSVVDNTGRMDSPTTNKAIVDDTGGWGSPVFENNSTKTNEQADATPQQEETTGWGAFSPKDDTSGRGSSSVQKQWGQ